MNASFYRSRCLLPLTMQSYSFYENQAPVSRPKGLPRFAQFNLCSHGTGEFIDDIGKSYIIRKGDIFWFTPDTPHSYSGISEKWTVGFVLIDGYDMRSFMQHLGYPRCGVLHADKHTLENIAFLHNEVYSHATDMSDLKVIARLSVLCYKTIIRLSRFLNDSSDDTRIKAQERLRPVISAIAARLGEDMTLDQLSAIIGVTPTYLCRIFKVAYNTSPITYIKNQRMEMAKQLLQWQKSRPIREIAAACGYADPGYFGKVFKKSFGITPEQFRENNTYGRSL